MSTTKGQGPKPPRRPLSKAAAEPRVQIVCGVSAVLAAFERRPAALRRMWLMREQVPAFVALTTALAEARLPFHVTTDLELARVSGSARHQGVVAYFEAPPSLTPEDVLTRFVGGSAGLALYLDGVGNPHNLGAIARTAAHFGVDILLQRAEEGAATMSAAAYRVAAGGLDAVPMVVVHNPVVALQDLRHCGARLIATGATADVALFGPDAPRLDGPVVWLLGEERTGLRDDVAAIADLHVAIPGTGAVESVNVAAAAAILLAETHRQRLAAARGR